MGQNEILSESTKKDSLVSGGLWAIPVKVKKKKCNLNQGSRTTDTANDAT